MDENMDEKCARPRGHQKLTWLSKIKSNLWDIYKNELKAAYELAKDKLAWQKCFN